MLIGKRNLHQKLENFIINKIRENHISDGQKDDIWNCRAALLLKKN